MKRQCDTKNYAIAKSAKIVKNTKEVKNISELPPEILIKIFGYLSDRDLDCLDQVSKKFHPFCQKIRIERIEREKLDCHFRGEYSCRIEKVPEKYRSSYSNRDHELCYDGEDAYEEIEHELDSMDLTSKGLFKLCYMSKYFPPYFGMNFKFLWL